MAPLLAAAMLYLLAAATCNDSSALLLASLWAHNVCFCHSDEMGDTIMTRIYALKQNVNLKASVSKQNVPAEFHLPIVSYADS